MPHTYIPKIQEDMAVIAITISKLNKSDNKTFAIASII